jgi:hypothetical protein
MAETLNTHRASQDGGVGHQFRATRYLRPVLAGVVVASTLTGCAELRQLTYTEEERRIYGTLELTDWCGRQPDMVCIREN